MWISSVVGMFSVVQAGPEPGQRSNAPRKLMVRARVRRHLELLQSAHPALQPLPILESDPGRDYRWRIIVPRRVFARVVGTMVLGIGYGNFKGACAASPDLAQDYSSALHEVWSAFRRLQK